MTDLDKINKVFDEMRSAHEDFTKKVDEQLGERSVDPLAQAGIDKANDAVTALRAEMDALVASNKRQIPSGSDNDLTPEQELRNSGFDKMMRYGTGEASIGMMSDEERRSLSGTSEKDGGSLVPTSFESEVLMEAFEEGELRDLVQASPTGRDTVYLSSMSQPIVGWGKKGLKVAKQDLSTGGERITIFDMRALVTVANNTLDDAEADVWGELTRAFGKAVGAEEDNVIMSAPGHESPQGILANPDVLSNIYKTGVANALNNGTINGIDALITMLYSLKKTYRKNATWMMNSTTEGIIRTLKDDEGDYLWQPPVQAGAPALLLGQPIANPVIMPDIAPGTIPIAVGDLNAGYKLRDRSGLSIMRLSEHYAEEDETGFMLKKRLGGQVTMAEAFRVLKVAV